MEVQLLQQLGWTFRYQTPDQGRAVYPTPSPLAIVLYNERVAQIFVATS